MRRLAIAGGFALVVLAAGCSSGDVQALPPEDDGVVADSTTSSSSTTTTVEATSSTSTTLSELAEAEAEIEAAIVGWWTFPSDTSLGEDGLPLEYLADPILKRVRELGEVRMEAGQRLRARGNSRIRIDLTDVDFDTGLAEVDVCSLGDHELTDVETGEILASDIEQGFVGVVIAEEIGGDWKVRDFFTSQAGDSPEECDVDA